MAVTDFAFTRNCSGVGICAPLDASGIDVSLVGGQLRFAGGFTALSVGGVATADFLIAYNILSVPTIDRVGLLFNGSVIGDSSFAEVVETVITPIAHLAGQGSVAAPSGPLAQLIVLDDDYHALKIVKDILLVGADTDGLGVASISLIDQFYVAPGQPSPFCVEGVDCDVVPEPSTYAMLGLGLVGFYFAKRRS
jgi:hypothetical protein